MHLHREAGMDYIDMLQWPAMVVTIAAAWLVASLSKRKRTIGFWIFLLSNVLWSIWGWHQQAYALIMLQVFLAAMNARGVYKNDPELAQPDATTNQ
jgi:nicotinamide riboside transporter PnuC